MNNYNQYPNYQPNYYPQPTPMQNMPMNNYYQQQRNGNYYDYVNGIDGVKAYQVPSGKSILLIDRDNPVFYLKSISDLGQANIRTFKFEEVVEPKEEDKKYMTREEVDELIKTALANANKGKKMSGVDNNG